MEGIRTLFRGDAPLPIYIFCRHCHYSSASAHKARFSTFDRELYLQNLLETIGEDPHVRLTFLLDTFHPMEEAHFLRKETRFPVVEFKAGSEAASFLYMLEYVLHQKIPADAIIYFLEDDYIHRPGWVSALREAFTIPGIDYATLYDHKDKYFLPQYDTLQSRIFHTQSCHWRTTPSTTNTYAMQLKTLKKHIHIHRMFSLGRTITADHDKFIKLAEEGACLISSIPGYSTHAEPDFASPCLDWDVVLSPVSVKK